MVHKVLIGMGAALAAVLMVVSLWTWQTAEHLQVGAENPQVVLLAVRSAAVAAGALAQGVILVFVIGNLYRTRLSDVLLRLVTGTVFAVSLVSAIALGLAGR